MTKGIAMGVTFQANGLAYEMSYDCGYATFDRYRMDLAQSINPVVGRIYETMMMGDTENEEIDGREVLMLSLDAYDLDGIEDDGTADITAWLRRLCPVGTTDGGLAIRPVTDDGSLVDIRMTYDALNEMMRNAYGEDLASFLSAPDCEGELTGTECDGILRDLERHGPVSVPTMGHNYGETELSVDGDGKRHVTVRHYNMHEQFVGMFRHCAETGNPLTWC